MVVPELLLLQDLSWPSDDIVANVRLISIYLMKLWQIQDKCRFCLFVVVFCYLGIVCLNLGTMVVVVTCPPCSAHARTPSRASARASQSLKDVSIGDVLSLRDVSIGDVFCPRDVSPEICCYWWYLFLRYVSVVDVFSESCFYCCCFVLRDDAQEMCLLRDFSSCVLFLFLGDVSIAGVLFLRDFLILQRAMLKDPSGPKPFPISFLLVSK